MDSKSKKKLKGTKNRTLVLLAIAVLVIGVIVAFVFMGESDGPLKGRASVTSGIPKGVESTPGAKTSAKYRELQEAANLEGTKEAEEDGATFIPTIIDSPPPGSSFEATACEDPLKEVYNLERLLSEQPQLAALLKDNPELAALLKRSPHLAELLAKNPHLAQLLADNPELAQLLADNPLLAKLLADNPMLAKILKECPALASKIADNPHLADMLIKQPQLGKKLCNNPELLQMLIDNPHMAEMLAENPQLLGKILADQALETSLKNNPHLADMLAKSPQLAELLKNNPELAKLLENNPHLARLLADNPQLAKLLANNPELAKLLADNPHLAKLLQDHPELAKLLNDCPLLAQKLAENPKLADMLIKQPQLGKTLCNNPELAQMLSDNPQLAQMLADNPELAQMLLDDPSLAKKWADNPNSIKQALNELKNQAALEEPEIPVDTDDPLAARILADKRRDELESEALRRSAELHALQEARAAAVADVSSKMSGQAQAMMSAWGSVPMQGYQQGDFSAATLMDAEQQAMAETLEAEAEAGVPPGQVILKSGDIMYATLETGINSDEPSPIMARIVHGPLKGAKLIGSMEPVSQESEKIVITFHSINIANQPQSYGISAVAIDPETARTAIATKVDKHYLSRYGALFASSFIAGYSKAIAEAGTSTTEEGTGDTAKTTTTNTGNQTSKQEIHSGLSKVADAWSETVAQNIERNPTITVKSGTSIGVLLTGDLQLGISPEEPGNESLSSEPIAAEE